MNWLFFYMLKDHKARVFWEASLSSEASPQTDEPSARDGDSPQGDIYRVSGRRTDLWGFEISLTSSEREILLGLSWSKPSKISPLECPVRFFWDIAFRGTAIPAQRKLDINVKMLSYVDS